MLRDNVFHIGSSFPLLRLQPSQVVSFQSWCGGLPAPECNNNPLKYKFRYAHVEVRSHHSNNSLTELQMQQRVIVSASLTCYYSNNN